MSCHFGFDTPKEDKNATRRNTGNLTETKTGGQWRKKLRLLGTSMNAETLPELFWVTSTTAAAVMSDQCVNILSHLHEHGVCCRKGR